MNNETKIRPKVVVRAWGDEPVVLFLQAIDRTHAYVGQEGSGKVIGLPHNQVFLFNQADFLALKNAYACGNVDKLSSIYSQLEINSPCNRYQDNVESGHDKENVTDSASVAGRHEQ
jgi:hypothetical protein